MRICQETRGLSPGRDGTRPILGANALSSGQAPAWDGRVPSRPTLQDERKRPSRNPVILFCACKQASRSTGVQTVLDIQTGIPHLCEFVAQRTRADTQLVCSFLALATFCTQYIHDQLVLALPDA